MRRAFKAKRLSLGVVSRKGGGGGGEGVLIRSYKLCHRLVK